MARHGTKFFIFVVLAVVLPFICLRPASATTRKFAEVSVSRPQNAAEPDMPDCLPYSLSVERLILVQPLTAPPRSPEQTHHRLRPMFFQTLYEHPLTPRQVAIRDSVLSLSNRRSQYVRVHLANQLVLTGTICGANRHGFLLQTDIAHWRRIAYSELAEPVRPVAGVGTRMVRGLETTGMVVALIILIPVAIPLFMTGVISD
jgi:hypothetical protein